MRQIIENWVRQGSKQGSKQGSLKIITIILVDN